MRIAALYLPLVRIELARARAAGEGDRPLAVVIARPGGAVKDERSLLGGTRLDAVSPEARAIGVRPGETIAAARARHADLCVRVVAEEAVRGVLCAVAEASLSFGRTASIDEARDVVCVDVTGCGHLFGGEAELARALAARVLSMRHGPPRVAVADGPRVAAAIVRALRKKDTFVVAPGKNASAIRALPISALPVDPVSVAWLGKLGCLHIGDLQRLPPAGLATRLGAAHAEVMALLAGDDGAPLDAYVPPEVPEERAELEYGVEKTEALLFVMKTLCDRLAARLAGRAMAATRVEIVLSLDRGIARGQGREGEKEASLSLSLPAPVASATELFAVVRARVESWTIPAPILTASFRATELARKEGRALHLFEPEAKADVALPRLVAELSADLGEDRTGTLALVNTWVPEERSALVPYGRPRPTAPVSVPLESPAPEPTRVLPDPLSTEGFREVRLAARIESVAWWRLGIFARDYVEAWSEGDARMAWAEVDPMTGQARVKGWMD
jgi:protein ImuB